MRKSIGIIGVTACVLSLLGFGGCGQKPAGEAAPPPPFTMTSPEQTIESFVANLRYEQTLIAGKQRAAAAQAAVDGKRLLAGEQLEAIARRQMKENPMYETVFGDDPVLAWRNNWAAMMLHDLKTLDLNQMRLVLSPDNKRQVRYHLPSGGGIYTIELANLGDRWAISMITPEAIKEVKAFVPASEATGVPAAPGASVPASAPTSASAP